MWHCIAGHIKRKDKERYCDMGLTFFFWGWVGLLTACGGFCLCTIDKLHQAEPKRLTQKHFRHLFFSGLIAFPSICVVAYMVRNDSHIWWGLFLLTIIAISCFAVVTSEWITKYKKFSSAEFELMILFGEALFFACIPATAYITGRITQLSI